jgi:hypothetical protein
MLPEQLWLLREGCIREITRMLTTLNPLVREDRIIKIISEYETPQLIVLMTELQTAV